MALFVDRVAELPRLLDALQYHPQGLSVADLAAEVGRTPEQVHEALLTYYVTDMAMYEPGLLGRPPAIEFVGGPEDSDDLLEASTVRLAAADDPTRELGVAYLPVAELARLYRAGRVQLELDPDNEVLRSAVEKLRAGLLPGVTPVQRPQPLSVPAAFEQARRERRRVRITYPRAWHPGIPDRLVDPYQLLRTRLGWEVDTGPPDPEGHLRTYLLDRITAYVVLDETFEAPVDRGDLLVRHRTPVAVELVVPHEARWSVEKYAHRVEVLEEDETTVRVCAHIVEPVRHRVGLILLDGGARAYVVEPQQYGDAGRELAAAVLAHYREL